MDTIRNMRELNLMKQKLRYKEKLYEKKVADSSEEVVDNLGQKLKDLAFDLGSKLLIQIIHAFQQKNNDEHE